MDANEAPAGRVLLVDGHDGFRTSTAALLAAAGFEVQAVASRREATRALARPIEVVLADYGLGAGPGGLDVIADAAAARPDALAMLLIGDPDLPQVRAAREDRRIYMVLAKPVSPELLVRYVRTAAGLSRFRARVRRLAALVGTG